MEQKRWYAVMMDQDDTNFGIGSYDLDTAKWMLLQHPDGYIAVILNGHCIDELYPEELDLDELDPDDY